jgi:hypothetical protein
VIERGALKSAACAGALEIAIARYGEKSEGVDFEIDTNPLLADLKRPSLSRS